jgi:hypothetical protein
MPRNGGATVGDPAALQMELKKPNMCFHGGHNAAVSCHQPVFLGFVAK